MIKPFLLLVFSIILCLSLQAQNPRDVMLCVSSTSITDSFSITFNQHIVFQGHLDKIGADSAYRIIKINPNFILKNNEIRICTFPKIPTTYRVWDDGSYWDLSDVEPYENMIVNITKSSLRIYKILNIFYYENTALISYSKIKKHTL